ncbi:MAG: hypothetical protein QM504_13615 [Pseudomonadota bacterium]
METCFENASEAWDNCLPVWVEILAKACDETSQREVAAQLTYGAAVVNQVLKNKYKGNLNNIKTAVEGAFLSAKVNCPVIGELSSNDCMDNQRKPFSMANSQRVQLFKACRSCDNNQIGR